MINIPDEYFKYLRSGKQTDGELSIDPRWYQLWPENELEELNEGYGVKEYLTGYYAFGTNGGGELFTFDTNGRIYMFPTVGMEEDTKILVADSWDIFEKAIITEPTD